jgi:hypothetical protein
VPKPRYNYRHGDFYRICDRSGFKVHASETRREWNGLIVRKQDWEPRHPQDFVRAKPDHQAVYHPRVGSETSLDLETTLDAAEASGQTVLSVASTANFAAAQTIFVQLDNDTYHQSTISSFVTNDTVTIADALPSAAASGNKVRVVRSTISESDL